MKTPERRVRHFVAALVAAAGSACASIPAESPSQSGAPAPAAPTLAVGDSWTYRVRNGFTGLVRPSERLRVAEVGADRIRVTVSRDNGGKDETQVYDSQWNWLARPATNLQSFNYDPAYRALSFPLAVGKSWRARLTATDPVDGRRFPVWIDATVEGWERVKVPAGEFDAVKIRRAVFFDYWESEVRGRSEIVEHEWYAPAIKQAVRREGRSKYLSALYAHDFGMSWVRDDWLIAELESYSVR